MDMDGAFCARTCVFLLSILCSCDAKFLLVAPNLIRTDSQENIFLQANHVTGTIPVTITMKDFYTGESLSEHYAILNEANGHHTLAAVQLPSSSLQREEKDIKHVFLEVKFGDMHTEKKLLMVSFQSGYIFIQTDKPIYKPEENVNVRAYVASTTFKASNANPVTIEIKNGDSVVHQLQNSQPKHGIVATNYNLPKIASEGKWTIMARFDHWPQNNFNTTFEVKKYVLPAFNVTVTPRKLYVDVDDKILFVDISARYLFGESVIGTAYVTYGLREGQKIKRAPKVKTVEMKEEGGTLNFTMDELKEACDVWTGQSPECPLDGRHVFIKLTVLTESGGDLVEVENSNIKIVKSPFVLKLKAMSKYFKPGFSFHFAVDVSYHDGTPAPRVPLEIFLENNPEDISFSPSINMPHLTEPQKIIVKTNQPDLDETRQAKTEVTVEPYTPANPSKPNYLYIHDPNRKVDMGGMSIQMSIKSESRSSIDEVTYLVLCKGKIMEAKRVPVAGLEVFTVQISVTAEMRPTFRIVAFYLMGTEVVSDSVKLEVSNTCVQPPIVSITSKELKPGGALKLKIEGEPSARISLVVVDQAVHLLSKNRFNQRHILDEVDSRDPGCSHGSGKNAMGVFSDTGLLFTMKDGPSSGHRKELNCPRDVRRRRSAVEQQEQLVEQFRGKLLQRCCRDGLRRLLMKYSCKQRSLYIAEGPECVQAFLECCNIYTNKVNTRDPDDEELARNSGSGSSFDVDPDENNALDKLGMDIENIDLRKNFEDTWLWIDVSLPAKADSKGLASLSHTSAIKDSLTEWSLLAVSSSMETGFCVAEPLTFVVTKKFFVDLKLPYSVARNEQVEIKAVVYNYLEDDTLDVTVVLSKTSHMCSVAFRRSHRQTVEVGPMSSTVVRYTIVPFEAGRIPIEVSAYVMNQGSDRIEKKLHVVVEGVQKADHTMVQLNPAAHEGKQVVRANKPVLTGVVPRSTPETKIILTGNILAESLQNALHDHPLSSLIRMPGGCVEQNLAAMTFPLIAALYLDQTKAWETVGAQRKTDALQYIKSGYSTQLNYKRADGSYPPYRGRGPSTWITAYVVKVFTMAYTLLAKNRQNVVKVEEICRPLSFLLTKTQSGDGSFIEKNPVSDRGMMGGVHGSDPALTAFVSIALAEVGNANIDCSFFGRHMKSALPTAVDKAVPYLRAQLQTSSSRPYTKAITAYSLALLTDRSRHNDISSTLLAASSGGTFWPDPNRMSSLEATGYALLALVKMGRRTEAEKPFAYLRDHRNIGGGSGNTQSTMVVLHALTEYLSDHPAPVQSNLSVTLSSSKRSNNLIFTSESSFHVRSFNVLRDEDFDVEARGNAKGTVEVVTYFNQLPEANAKSCETFDMRVTIERSKDRPRQGLINIFELSIDVTARGPNPALSVVLDISLPTGFTLETSDLEKLLSTAERFIDQFYFEDKLSDRSSLIIHMYEVSNTRPHVVTFRLLQQFNVGLLQPSSITVYKYYEGERCTQLYSVPQDQVKLSSICRNNVCQCMQDNCCKIKGETEEIPMKDRLAFPCRTLHHVFKVKVLNVSVEYHVQFEVEITQVIKTGDESEVRPERRLFFTDVSCRNQCMLQVDSEYLIMGPQTDKWTRDSTNKFTYVMGQDTWVERWPSAEEGKDPALKAKHHLLTEATNELLNEVCRAK